MKGAHGKPDKINALVLIDSLKLKAMKNNPLHCDALMHSLIRKTGTICIEGDIALKRLFYCFVNPDLHHFSCPESESNVRFNK